MNYRKLFLKSSLIFGMVLGVLFLCYAIFRGSLLELAVEKAQRKLLRDYGLNLQVGNASFTGMFAVQMDQISIIPDGNDTLLNIDTAAFSLRLLPLLTGKVQLKSLHLGGPNLRIFNEPERCNWCAIKRPKNQSSSKKSAAEIVFRLIESTLNQIPQAVVVNRARALYSDSSGAVQLQVPHFLLEHQAFRTTFSTSSNRGIQDWQADGTLDPGALTGTFRLSALNNNQRTGPKLSNWFGINAGWNMLRASFSKIRFEEETLYMNLEGGIEQLSVQHERISDSVVVIPSAKANLVIRLGRNQVELDSASTGSIDKLKWNMYARYAWQPERDYTLALNIPWTPAQDFLGSLPAALFANLSGIRAEGNMRYRFRMHINDKNPDAATLYSAMEEQNLHISRFGAAKLQDLHLPFSYYFFLNGNLQRSVYVGPENGNFRRLDQIAPELRNAVLTGEDPNFYYHKGFEPEALRGALIANYKAGRFRRGGSTITMQLVKNLFLSRRKTLARKLEEVLLVWLLENHTNINKNRLFEIYLNIIEWGPGIIGANEAAQFYFAKDASALNALESAYLAAIVPSPRRFAGWFDAKGKLTRNDLHFRVIRQVMQNKGMAPADTSSQVPSLYLRGRAINLLRKDTTINTNNSTEPWTE
jgi:hypothetical protein